MILALTCAAFLIGCGDKAMPPQPDLVIPEELRRPVVVRCGSGTTEKAVGDCLFALRGGLNEANSQIKAIDDLYVAALDAGKKPQ